MGFNLGGSLLGGAAGFGGALLGGFGQDLLGKQGTIQQVPLETPEQKAAREKLMQFAQTGIFGDFKAGDQVPLGYGDYNTTGIEQQGLSSLQGLLQSGIPDQFKMGDQALQDLLATSPQQIASQFEPYKAQVQRSINESNTALKRGAGFAGNLYSTETIRNLGDIQARGNETLSSQLASLTNEALNRRLQAVPLAYQSGQAQENIAQNRIGSAMQYGGLTRQLNDASIKARDAELLRRRQELQLPINAAGTVAGQNANFGISNVPYQQPSQLADILGLVANIGGRFMGAGGFGGGAPTPGSTSPTRFGLPPNLSLI
jgi:hypothetical protein